MRTYDVHGVVVVVDAPPDIAEVVDGRLLAFRATDAAPPAVTMTWRRVEDGDGAGRLQRPVGPGRPVYDRDGADVLWWDDADTLFVHDPVVRAACRPRAGTVEIELAGAQGPATWLATHGILTLTLFEVLRRRALYNIHAGTVATDHGALLLPGESGAGKTTLSLALARSGLPLMGDDMALLRRVDRVVEVHAFPDEVDVTEQTVRLLPWLAEHVTGEPPDGWVKWPLRAEKIVPTADVSAMAPLALLFPRVSGGARTSVEQLDADAALRALLPNLLLTAADVVRAHIELFGRLVRDVPAYLVRTGSDPAEAAGAVRRAVGVG